MSATEYVMHSQFAAVVAEYHPFAEYIGYQEADGGFLIAYRGPNGDHCMAIDVHGNIVGDSSFGSSRTAAVVGVGLAILGALMGGGSNRY